MGNRRRSGLDQLVADQVLNTQVRDETYRQFEEAAAARDQADAAVNEAVASLDKAQADLEGAIVDIEGRASRPDRRPVRAKPGPGDRRLWRDQGPLRRRDHPAERQPRRLPPGRWRDRRSPFVHPRTDRPGPRLRGRARAGRRLHQGRRHRPDPDPGPSRVPSVAGKIVRSGFSLNPSRPDPPGRDRHPPTRTGTSDRGCTPR